MKIQKPTFEIWLQEQGMDGVYRQIERAGRVCYKSEDRQTADSAKPFCQRMIDNQHYAMLEHGSLYLVFDAAEGAEAVDFYSHNRFSHCKEHDGKCYVSTNLRVLAENKRLDDAQCLTEPTEWHDRRITVHFTTQVGVTREFNRHRVNSMAEQSTRYCNYSKNKFGGEMTVNLPTWVRDADQEGFASAMATGEVSLGDEEITALCAKVLSGNASDMENWLFGNIAAEKTYMNLIANGRKPQEARVVLPLDINTELVHTAFVSDWLHFFDLRALDKTGAAHPDAKVLAVPLYELFRSEGII